jgi:hypothetical protein
VTPSITQPKWVVALPNGGWKEGVELDIDAKKGVITLRPKDEAVR